jgi:hypothetical protein
MRVITSGSDPFDALVTQAIFDTHDALSVDNAGLEPCVDQSTFREVGQATTRSECQIGHDIRWRVPLFAGLLTRFGSASMMIMTLLAIAAAERSDVDPHEALPGFGDVAHFTIFAWIGSRARHRHRSTTSCFARAAKGYVHRSAVPGNLASAPTRGSGPPPHADTAPALTASHATHYGRAQAGQVAQSMWPAS